MNEQDAGIRKEEKKKTGAALRTARDDRPDYLRLVSL
jgi:hypothetical protein